MKSFFETLLDLMVYTPSITSRFKNVHLQSCQRMLKFTLPLVQLLIPNLMSQIPLNLVICAMLD